MLRRRASGPASTTPASTRYLTAEELAYIVNNSQSKVLITSQAKRDGGARRARAQCPKVELCLVVDGPGDGDNVRSTSTRRRRPTRRRRSPTSRSARRCSIRRARPGGRRASCGRCRSSRRRDAAAALRFLLELWRYREGMIYLSPAPLYHSAPQARGRPDDPQRRHGDHHGALRSRAVPAAGREVPRHPQPARADDVLAHAQAARGGARSATTCRRWRSSIHAAAPCPVQVKEQMIEWWGPIIHEYYGATEGLGFTACDIARVAGAPRHRRQGAARRAARARRGDAAGARRARPGTLWFKTATTVRLLQRSGEDRGGDARPTAR